MPGAVISWTKSFFLKKEIPFSFFERADSCNDLAKARAFKGLASPAVFLARHQTKGRGREGRVWEDSDLMISFLWENNLKKLSKSNSEDFARGLLKALKKSWPELKLSVKAPNDLLLEGKKTAGLLLEALSQGPQTALIAGLGLNVFSAPKGLRAGFLAEGAQNINEKAWAVFLEELFSSWSGKAAPSNKRRL